MRQTRHTNARTILFTVFFLVAGCVFSQLEEKCKDVRTGKFQLDSEYSGTTIITRSKKFQVEEDEEHHIKVRFEIVWVNACTYELRGKKVYRGPEWLSGGENDVDDEKMTIVASSNFSDMELESEIKILR